jgi:hypothetical protein
MYLLKDDVVTIVLDCGRDITKAVSYELDVVIPDGSRVTWPAEIKDKNSLTVDRTPANLPMSGKYLLRAKIIIGNTEHYGEWANVTVSIPEKAKPVRAFKIDGLIRRIRIDV